jgi:hypothetical protein
MHSTFGNSFNIRHSEMRHPGARRAIIPIRVPHPIRAAEVVIYISIMFMTIISRCPRTFGMIPRWPPEMGNVLSGILYVTYDVEYGQIPSSFRYRETAVTVRSQKYGLIPQEA